jgi:hypothetical protein
MIECLKTSRQKFPPPGLSHLKNQLQQLRVLEDEEAKKFLKSVKRLKRENQN